MITYICVTLMVIGMLCIYQLIRIPYINNKMNDIIDKFFSHTQEDINKGKMGHLTREYYAKIQDEFIRLVMMMLTHFWVWDLSDFNSEIERVFNNFGYSYESNIKKTRGVI